MKLENQVVSLELAKELKENGYVQEGLWWWLNFGENSVTGERENWRLEYDADYFHEKFDNWCVAPTVAELGERLPFGSSSGRTDYELGQEKAFFCDWKKEAELKGEPDIIFFADTEANARAKMWLYLKKKGKL